MASVIRETVIEASPAQVWAVIGDFAEGPVRMAPGFVTHSRLETPEIREVTFANGDVARERLIARDPAAHRIVWEFFDGWAQPTHNNSAMHVLEHTDGHSRLQWIHDVLPANLTEPLAAAMDGGLQLIKKTIENKTDR